MHVFRHFRHSFGCGYDRGFGEIRRQRDLLFVRKCKIFEKKNSSKIQTKTFGIGRSRVHNGPNADPNGGGGDRKKTTHGIKRFHCDADRKNADPPKFGFADSFGIFGIGGGDVPFLGKLESRRQVKKFLSKNQQKKKFSFHFQYF